MTTQGTQTPPAGFWRIRHLAIGLGVLLLVVLMVRACGSDEEGKQASKREEDMPRQSIVVQIPEPQWQQQAPVQPPAPPQPGYGYVPRQAQPPVADPDNPWSVQAPRPYDYGQTGGSARPQWGQTQQQRPAPQYVPSTPGAVYRPLDEEDDGRRTSRRAAPPVQPREYRPVAPYDRPAGSSFSEDARSAYPYPYGGYPGYYGPYGGATGVPYPPAGYPAWPGGW